MTYTYKYARPAVTADCVLFARNDGGFKVLLIQRAHDPFKGQWALPGGFAEVGENLDETARRELEEETGLKEISLKQFHAFSDPDRDPREHVITVAYYALVEQAEHRPRASSDARDAAWFPLGELPNLAFDHDEIIAMAYDLLRKELSTSILPI